MAWRSSVALLLLCFVAAPCGASKASEALTAAVYRGEPVPELVSDVLRDAKEEMAPAFLQLQTVYRHDTGILHQGLALLKEMKYDVQARIDEVSRLTANCNKKKQDAYKRAAADKNASEADVAKALVEVNQTEQILAAASATLQSKNKSTAEVLRTKSKRIAELENVVNRTKQQLKLINTVISIVKDMNKTWHTKNENKYVDITPVMTLLYGVVANLRVEINAVKADIGNRYVKMTEATKSLTAEKEAFKAAKAKYDNTTNRLDNETARLHKAIDDANARLSAIGIEREDCVTEVSTDSRSHDESMQVITFIITYFEKLLGYGGNSTVVAGNATAEDANGTSTSIDDIVAKTNSTVDSEPVGAANVSDPVAVADEPAPTAVANETAAEKGMRSGQQVMADIVKSMKAKNDVAEEVAEEPLQATEEESVEDNVIASKTKSFPSALESKAGSASASGSGSSASAAASGVGSSLHQVHQVRHV